MDLLTQYNNITFLSVLNMSNSPERINEVKDHNCALGVTTVPECFALILLNSVLLQNTS
jgi:hypothetical protein